MTQLELLGELRKLGAKTVTFDGGVNVLEVEFYPQEPPPPVFLDKIQAEVATDIKRHMEAVDERLLYHSA